MKVLTHVHFFVVILAFEIYFRNEVEVGVVHRWGCGPITPTLKRAKSDVGLIS